MRDATRQLVSSFCHSFRISFCHSFRISFLSAGLVACAAAALIGCDEPLADEPAIDPDAPVVRISSPARGAYLGDVSTVTISGSVRDDSPLRALTINGAPLPLDALGADGAFTAIVPVSPTGTALYTVEAIDTDGNLGRETRAFSAGPLVATGQRHADAVTAALSDTAFSALGNAAAALLAGSDLGAWIAPFNPVISKGAPDGPDCLFGDVSIGALDLEGASLELLPTLGGLELVAELSGVTVPMHLRYAAFCVDGQSDVAMTATKVRITGKLTAAIKEGRFDFKLVGARAAFEGFHLELPGIPGRVVTLLDLDNALGPVLAWAVEQFAAPMLGDALAGLDGTTSVQVLGKTLELEVTPAELAFSPADARVRLDTRFHVAGDTDGRFVAAANTRPAMQPGDGLELAVADEAVNSLLASFWAARGMELSLDLTTGDYGGLGKLYDRVAISGALPLAVRAEGGGAQLIVPELTVAFYAGDERVTQIALNGEIDVAVGQGGDGALRLATEAPRVFVDILDEGVVGANPLSSSQLEVLVSFALERLTGVATGVLGAVPLPTSGAGVQLRNVATRGEGGYLMIQAEAK